jgi:hypothetical protein
VASAVTTDIADASRLHLDLEIASAGRREPLQYDRSVAVVAEDVVELHGIGTDGQHALRVVDTDDRPLTVHLTARIRGAWRAAHDP